MLFHKPAQADQLDYVEAINEASGARDSVAVSVSLIYDCCRDLQDPALHEALGVTDPYDTVRRLMDIGRSTSWARRWRGGSACCRTAARTKPRRAAGDRRASR